ncbi:MAG: type II secretion system protein [Patescibacteria group bacterium]
MKDIIKKQKGFTIIEVLIVLAIAGLIILIVFLAVPALQRNSRNTQRKNDASAVLGATQEDVNNNNGAFRVVATTPNTINTTARTQLTTINYNGVASGTANTLPANVNAETILVRNNLKCNNLGANAYVSPGNETDNVATTVGATAANIATAVSATSRTAVVIYAIERQGGLTGVCQEL